MKSIAGTVFIYLLESEAYVQKKEAQKMVPVSKCSGNKIFLTRVTKKDK